MVFSRVVELPVERVRTGSSTNSSLSMETAVSCSPIRRNPAWREDKVDTISVNHLILARKELSEAKAAAFYRQLVAVRDTITRRVAGALTSRSRRQSPPCTGAPPRLSTGPSGRFLTSTATTSGSLCFFSPGSAWPPPDCAAI